MINNVIVHFAATYDGYLKPLRFLIKVYPQLNDKILFIGLVQNSPKGYD